MRLVIVAGLAVVAALQVFGLVLLVWWAGRSLPWGWPLFAVLAVFGLIFAFAVWRGRAESLSDDW